jgi:TonB-dependent starch-binding outer membrane protein SusC
MHLLLQANVCHKRFTKKLLLLMHLTAALLLLVCLQVTARTFSQKVSISANNLPLTQVFRSIEKQTGYQFFYNKALIKQSKPVTIEIKNTDLSKALGLCLLSQNLNFSIEDKFIVVVPLFSTGRSNSLLNESNLSRNPVFEIPPITVRGRITDENGNPLSGASIFIKGSRTGTSTDADGNFKITAEVGDLLLISSIGYNQKEIKITGDNIGEITLTIINAEMQEVTVNKGYYSEKKILSTGNVSTVTAKDLSKNPVGDPLQALQGRVPGLYLSQRSGITGAASIFRLRGQNSLRTSPANDPLFVVDGIPYEANTPNNSLNGGATGGLISPFSNIQLNDIESVSVLKDADATAIYGSRGANGVILITTKKAKADVTKVNVNVYHGVNSVARRVDFMNTQEYLAMRRKALANDGIAQPSATDYDLNGKWGDINRYTDWQKVLIGGAGHVTDAQASVSGGNSQTQMLIGGEYRKETTVFPGDYNDEKVSGHINISHRSTNSKFKTSLTGSYLRDKNHLPEIDFTRYILYAPNSPELYNPDGTLNWQNSTWNNPLTSISQNTTINTTNFITDISLSYEVINSLTISARAAYNSLLTNASTITPLKNANPAFGDSPDLRSNQFSNSEGNTVILEPTINYKKLFRFGSLALTVGSTWQTRDFSSFRLTATGFSSDALIKNINVATSVGSSSAPMSKYRYSAIYARIGYNYKDQYILNLTGRRDASSRFGPGNQFGNFGAVGAAWVFSKQPAVVNNISFLSFGKIRGSYGITGNDQIPDYQFLNTYVANALTYQGISILNPNTLGNNNFGWETVKKLDLGIDLSFFNNRIQFNGTWYKNRTANQLVGLDLPDVAGVSSVQANLPALLQNTGTELELTTNNITGKNFTWTTTANLTVPKNKLIRFDNFESSPYTTRFRIGEPLAIRLGYQYTGLDPITNIYTFADLNKDGNINTADYVARFFGQRYYGGINNSFSYKGLQLDVFFQYVNQVGGQTVTARAPGFINSGFGNIIKSNAPDFNAELQEYTQTTSSAASKAYSLYLSSDALYVNTSFIRLKNLSLSWSLPARYLKLIKLQTARLYLQGQNLLTITKYKGLDPETANGTGVSNFTLPPLRVLTAGIQLSL